ncbi:MAG: 30S ribosomal protein S12 methylthiotransferase RimO [Leptospiraceae bacterium]|nr:30S ribosomal protein S12 methylthiotransferase RimO [Leptospiraceae bacterium]MCP5511725.1 30S ribosomal protein S12 methylthiotransferase RimO [Leptospiraceae bacterium]
MKTTGNSSRKSFYITTLGCPKNTADSLHMEESLLKEGLVPAKSAESSDFHLINTCSFIQSANEETIDTVLSAARIKKRRRQKLVVVGCFAERYPNEIKTDIPEVDLVFGTGRYKEAGSILSQNFSKDFLNSTATSEIETREQITSRIKNENLPYSYIKISDGCNRGCNFCIIPNLRGKFRDRPEEEILSDIDLALNSGKKEICLVSQDTNFYGKDIDSLKNLIRKISEFNGLEILRLLYLYPDKKTHQLLDLFSEVPNLAPYFESPIQHVSQKVLKSMNRSGSLEFYEDLFSKARNLKKDLEIRTSIILGYPGETEEDVNQVETFIRKVRPEKLALFSFSPQEGTEAFNREDDVEESEKARRINHIRNIHLEILKETHLNRIGKSFPAIVDKVTKTETIVRRFQDAPEIDEVVFTNTPNLKVGMIGNVKIESFAEYDMEGSFLISEN